MIYLNKNCYNVYKESSTGFVPWFGSVIIIICLGVMRGICLEELGTLTARFRYAD